MEILEFKPIIENVARDTYFSSPVLSLSDLEQVGYLSAFKALKTFRLDKGPKIKSYVYKCVQRAIQEEASNFYGPYRLPHRILRLLVKINKLYIKGCSDYEISQILNKEKSPIKKMTPDLVKQMRLIFRGTQKDISPLLTDEIPKLAELSLTDLERKVIYYRFLNNLPKKDTSALLGLNKKNLNIIEDDLRAKLKEFYEYKEENII